MRETHPTGSVLDARFQVFGINGYRLQSSMLRDGLPSRKKGKISEKVLDPTIIWE